MKLHGVTRIDYNITENLRNLAAERLVRELSEDVATTVASWYILNESTNKYEIDEQLVNEGIRDILKKGVSKINDAITKGYSDIDAVKTKVLQGLKGKGDPGMMSKLGELAKKNAKYIKPAMMIAIVGASLLGMDTASASEALNQFDQMQGQEFQDYVNNLNQEFQGGDAAGGDAGQQAQAPQEDKSAQYDGGDAAGDGGAQQISPKLKAALTDKVDGVFKIGDSQAEGGLKTLNSKQAIYLAQEMTGDTIDQAIQKIIQNSSSTEEVVRGFKDWVGTGVKKYAMR